MSTTSKESPADLSYFELKQLLEEKKAAEIEKVTKELQAAEGTVAALKQQLVNLGAIAPERTTRRGRPPGSAKRNGASATKKTSKGKRGKRGALGEAITAFLSGKGKKGAHTNEIGEAVGKPPANVTAWVYTTGKTKVKKVAPSTFALK